VLRMWKIWIDFLRDKSTDLGNFVDTTIIIDSV